MDMRLKTDAVLQVVGPSGSGKTHFVCQLLSTPGLFKNTIKNIYWIRGIEEGESGATAKCMRKLDGKITFVNGFEAGWEQMAKKGDVLVIDDLFQESTREKNVTNLFTKVARHRQVFVIFITQNLFHQGGDHRTRNLNVHYMTLFRNPRDNTMIDFLARQIFPQNRQFLIDAFEDATSNKPHGYLFFDFTQECPDELRIRTNVLQPHSMIIYKQTKH